MRALRILVVVALALFALSLAGCQIIAEKAAETAVEQATGTDIDQYDGSVTVEGDGGSTTVGTQKIPDGFPEDAPVYEPNTVTLGVSNETDGKTAFMVGLETEDSAADVIAFYEKEIPGEGWTPDQTVKMGDGAIITAKKDTRTLGVNIVPGSDGGKTQISLTIGED